MTAFLIAPAREADLDTILAFRLEASRWLQEKGIDQWTRPWPDEETQEQRILASIQAGETYMIWDRDAPIATVAVDTFADPRLWTEAERAEAAYYVHRLIVRRAYGGIGLGAEITDWAGARAAKAGKRWIRVDVWTTNVPLQRWYREQGFTHVRTLDTSDYPSGALFQRPTCVHPTPRLREVGGTPRARDL
ncbi:MAG: GNAT family N-acetyltransferase [Nocardioidaceae bacterium]